MTTDEEMKVWVADWNGPETTRAVAARRGVSTSNVDYFFRRLRREGMVPNVPRRRKGRSGGSRRRYTGERKEAWDRVQEQRDAEDGATSVFAGTLRVDLLLEALVREHGSDPLRQRDTVQTLAGAHQ